MKKLIILVGILCFFSNSALASNCTATCANITTLAETIMEKRQTGMAMSKLIAMVDEDTSPDLKEVLIEMIINAYETQKFDNRLFKENAVNDFKTKWHLGCIKEVCEGD